MGSNGKEGVEDRMRALARALVEERLGAADGDPGSAPPERQSWMNAYHRKTFPDADTDAARLPAGAPQPPGSNLTRAELVSIADKSAVST